MKKAIVAGHVCIDITPVIPDNLSFSEVGDAIRPGKLLQTGKPSIHTGGAVANTGLGMKVMGADVKLLGKIGHDEFGRMVRNVLDKHDAGGNLVEVKGETTSYTVVIAIPGIDRSFLHCPGANDTFGFDDIPERELNDAALFHFGYPTLMRKMYIDKGAELEKMFKSVKEMGLATSLDLAAVNSDSEAGKADWKGILERVLPYVDFFVPSFEELCFMLQREHYEELCAQSEDITLILDRERDIVPLAKMCLDMGAGAVLLKCGKPGMYLKTSSHMENTGKKLELDAESWNDREIFEKSYKIDRVLSGTGAGDTSIAAFLTSILEGCGPEESVQNAAAEGALCCTAYDSISGLKPLKEVRKMIEEGWEQY